MMAMIVILAHIFAPFNFSAVPSYSNPVPRIDEWHGSLPRFKELIEFHEHVHMMNIHSEDVLMKMFMYSLEDDAHDVGKSNHSQIRT